MKHNEDAEVTEAKEDQEVAEAGGDAEHSEHWGAGRQADARHSEGLKSATSWRVQSTREVRRMWTMPNRVQGGDGKGKLSRATGGMVIARGTYRTRLHAEMPKRLRETRSKRKVEGSQRRCRGLRTGMNICKELSPHKFREECGMLCATQAVAEKMVILLKMKSMLDAQRAVAHQ